MPGCEPACLMPCVPSSPLALEQLNDKIQPPNSSVRVQVGGFKDLNVFAITTHERGQDVHMQARHIHDGAAGWAEA